MKNVAAAALAALGLAGSALAALGLAFPARAEDLFEIQVYDGGMNPPGHAGLELHTNYAFRATSTATGPREIAPDRVFRTTLEPSLGVASWLELGAYLEGFLGPDGLYRYGGWKLRSKFGVPESAGLPVRLGLNVEVAHLPATVTSEAWGMELRPILAWQPGRWLVAFNPILDVPLSGADKGKPDLEPALKVAWDTQLGFAVGGEWYAGLGRLDRLEAPRDQSHLAFAVIDLADLPGHPEGPWELEAGLGAGITRGTSLGWVGKVIVGRGF